MKKILSFLIIVIFVLGFSDVLVNANEYLPISDNYIQNSNAEYVSDDNDYVNIIDYIRIEPNEVYSLLCYNQDIELISMEFFEYDDTKSKIGILKTEAFSPNQICLYTSANAKYIMGRFSYYGEPMASIEDTFCIYKGEATESDFDDLQVNDLGFDKNYVNVGENNVGYYYTSVDNPTLPETIKQAIRAVDNYDGDITENIITTIDTYSSNMNIVGNYKIRYEVTDSNLNTAKFTLNIIVKDVVSPVISGNKSYIYEPTDNISIEDITNQLIVSDNYYKQLSIDDVTILEETLIGNENRLGKYDITYQVEDGSGNIGDFSVSVTIKDMTAPVISGSNEIVLGVNEILSDDEILSKLKAVDSFEGDVSDSLVIVGNEHVGNEDEVGIYEIEVEAEDSSGNYATYYINVIGEDTVPPTFYITDMIINLETKQTISEQALIATVVQRYKIENYETAEVVLNEYSTNMSSEGSHRVLVKVDDKEYELVINAVEGLYNEVTYQQKTTFLRRLFDKVVEIVNKIKGFFLN